MPIIFCLLPSSSTVILVFYLFSTLQTTVSSMCENCECEMWIQFTGLTLPLRLTPVNNPITLISPVQSLGYIFSAADSICVALQISQQYSPKARMPTHWMPSLNEILMQNDHSRSLKIIRFGVNEEPLRGYIEHYNDYGLECLGSEDIASERSKNRHLRRPHSHLTPPI